MMLLISSHCPLKHCKKKKKKKAKQQLLKSLIENNQIEGLGLEEIANVITDTTEIITMIGCYEEIIKIQV